MLRTKSFKATDSDGINALLDSYPLAEGANILICASGDVIIPYEDGEPQPAVVQAIELKAQKNKMLRDRELIEHSQEVNKLQIADADSRIAVIRAEIDAATANPVRKEAEERLKVEENKLNQLEMQYRVNESEFARIDSNVEQFDRRVGELSK